MPVDDAVEPDFLFDTAQDALKSMVAALDHSIAGAPDQQILHFTRADGIYRALSTALLGSESDARFTGRLTNGEPVPACHDGMGAFPGPGGVTVLVRNHELDPQYAPTVDPTGRRRYDKLGTAGTTTLWVDTEGILVRSFPSKNFA